MSLFSALSARELSELFLQLSRLKPTQARTTSLLEAARLWVQVYPELAVACEVFCNTLNAHIARSRITPGNWRAVCEAGAALAQLLENLGDARLTFCQARIPGLCGWPLTREGNCTNTKHR